MDSPGDPLQAVSHRDPWPYYQRLLRERPFAWDRGLGLWVAAGAGAVREALAHPLLRVRPPAEPVPGALRGTAAGEVFALLVRMNDGDFHAVHRPGVDARLQAMTLPAVAEAASASADALVQRLAPAELCAALPVRAVAQLLGVPAGELDETTRWVQRFTLAIAPGAGAEAIAAGSEAALRLMAQGEAAGLPPPAAANRIALMQQSLDATSGLIANSLLRLQDEPALAAVAEASPAAMREFVAEVARWDAPVHHTRRFAAQDLDLCGERLRAGDGLLLVLAAANRDPALIPEPDRFWPGRPGPRNLGFGAGAHRCPGERIAVEIAAAALGRLRRHHGWRERRFRCTGLRPLPNARIPLITD